MKEHDLKIESILEEHCLNDGNYDTCKEKCKCFTLCEEWQREQLKRK